MNSTKALTKLKATLLIDLIIVTVASGTYLFLQSQGAFISLKPAEFTFTDLTIEPPEAAAGQSIAVSVNVTNIGEETGTHTVDLIINGIVKETKSIELLGAESKTVEFTIAESNSGSYSVEIEGLTGSFAISSAPPPSTLKISDLEVDPYESWVNETIKTSFKVSNTGTEALSYALTVRVNNTVKETKTVSLSAGETAIIESSFTMSSEGRYSVSVGGVAKPFTIVPTGKHTLIISSLGSIPFTINGESQSTPYSELLDVGTYTLTFPETVTYPRATYIFVKWNDGSWSLTKTVNLQKYTLVVAEYSYTRSCPSVYVWNGAKYVYRAEASSGTGYLGIPNYYGAKGVWESLGFLYSYPWDYIKLDPAQIQPRNGYYDITMNQIWDELFYIDTAKLIIVDHPQGTDVFSTMGTYLYNLNEQGVIYTVSKAPSPPTSAFSIFENGTRKNVLHEISKLDSFFTQSEGDFHWKTLELNLGDLSGAESIKLVVAGKTVYSTGKTQGEWAMQFVNNPGVMPFPPAYMEVKNAKGAWVRVPDNRQFPLVDVTNDEFAVNLTGLFPTNVYSLRIHSFFDVLFDYIGVDTTPQQKIIVREILPSHAELEQIKTTNSTSSGNFTRYGDVTELVKSADDMFVIGRQGDSVLLQFKTAGIPNVPAGMERDFIFVTSLWFKVDGLPYLSFTVDPLPFNKMSAFPYWPPESYPYDESHLNYLSKFNTRVIQAR